VAFLRSCSSSLPLPPAGPRTTTTTPQEPQQHTSHCPSQNYI
jgi:hypothetical protein